MLPKKWNSDELNTFFPRFFPGQCWLVEITAFTNLVMDFFVKNKFSTNQHWSGKKRGKKVFNSSEFHFFGSTSYEIHILVDKEWPNFGLWTTSTNKHLVCDSSVYPPWLQGISPSAVVGIGHCKEIDFQLTKLCIFWRFPSVTWMCTWSHKCTYPSLPLEHQAVAHWSTRKNWNNLL